MGCFPFFVELEQKEGLIVGGGVTALRKIQKLLPYGPRLTVVSPSIHPEIKLLPTLRLLCQPFEPALLDGKFFVIAATDDPPLNHQIARLCRQCGILVNVVDDRDACSFLFPALVKRGALTVGISTSGASPSAAIWLKEQINALLPDQMEDILSCLEAQRSTVRSMFPEEAQRSAAFKTLFLACMEHQRPLTEPEMAQLFSRLTEGAST